MNLIIASIPDDPSARVPWLEQQVTGLHLRELVSELSAFQVYEEPSNSMETVLAGYREAVLKQGLASLPADRIQILFKQPKLLYALQELVMIEGGAYWENLPIEPSHSGLVKQVFAAVQTRLAAEQSTKIRRPNFFRRSAFVLAMAAMLLLVAIVGIRQWSYPHWGFNNTSIYANNVLRPEYIKRLSNAAGEWFDQSSTPAKRIAEFKLGCQKILAAEHAPLKPTERDELLKRCRNWIVELDKLASELEKGSRAPAMVKADADALVRKLQSFLNQLT